MRKQFVENPAGEINIDDVLALRNSEVRRAVLGKIGFPRMLATFKHRVISRAGENRLIQFKVKGFAGREYFRVLHLKWKDKTGDKETFLPVPRLLRQFGDDRPENIKDCEQVRRWTLGWPKEALAIAET